MIRLAHFVTHPIQYFAPLYRELSGLPDIDLTVFFGSRHGLKPSHDAGFGQTIQFDVPLLEGYRSQFLNNRGAGNSSAGGYAQFDCPEAGDLFRPENFDLVWIHGWGNKAHWQIIAAARKNGLPFCMRGETSLLLKPKYSWRWLASRWRVGGLVRAAAGCLWIGQSNRDFYHSMGVPEERLFPAHYSVDAVRFQTAAASDRLQLREQFGATHDTFVVACSAKAIPRKRLQDAIRAVGRLPAQVVLWILGDGPQRQQLERLAVQETPGRVTWHGFVNQSQVPRLLGAADVFAFPSEAEPWGLAVNEAMACGLPAVCSADVGCAPDLIRPGQTGFTYPAGDVDALTACVRRLCQDREACRSMGRAAQELVLQEYDIKTTAAQIAHAARQVVTRHSSTARS